MVEAALKLGEEVDAGTKTMKDCLAGEDVPPLFKDGILFADQMHHLAVVAGGMGQAGSGANKQWRVSVKDDGTLAPVKNKGILPPRRQQIKPKYNEEARGTYFVAVPTKDGQRTGIFLPAHDYTGKRLESVKSYWKATVPSEIRRVKALKGKEKKKKNAKKKGSKRKASAASTATASLTATASTAIVIVS